MSRMSLSLPEELTKHEAWHGGTDRLRADNLLLSAPAGGWLLRQSSKPGRFCVSYRDLSHSGSSIAIRHIPYEFVWPKGNLVPIEATEEHYDSLDELTAWMVVQGYKLVRQTNKPAASLPAPEHERARTATTF